MESASPKGVNHFRRRVAYNAGRVSESARGTAVAAARRSSQTEVFSARTAAVHVVSVTTKVGFALPVPKVVG